VLILLQTKLLLNKSTKIRLNYLLGAILSLVLLWSIGRQVSIQFRKEGMQAWQHTGPVLYLVLCLILMPVNLGLEAKKWQLLAGMAQPIRFPEALKSVLCGIAFSMITPNRIGEYPGRLLALRRKNTPRLISVSLLGAFAQLIALFSFGLAGLVYYNIRFPGFWPRIALGGTALAVATTLLLYWRFEYWSKWLERIKWLRAFGTYTALLRRFENRTKQTIIFISLLRFAIFTGQYLLLLRWFNIAVPWLDGYLLAALFFWAMAVIPTISLAEAGVRMKVSLLLFGAYSANTIGILSGTLGLWCINLVLPAIVGSILLIRIRLLKD
jgi:hypothetical protein